MPKPQEASSGKKLASSLWSCGCVAVVVLGIAAVAGPKLISARTHGNESAAIGSLKTLHMAQSLIHEKNDRGRYGTLSELAEAELIDMVIGSGEKQGYRFECKPTTGGEGWWATAAPAVPGTTGNRYFATNHQELIYYALEPISVDPATGLPPEGTKLVGQ